MKMTTHVILKRWEISDASSHKKEKILIRINGLVLEDMPRKRGPEECLLKGSKKEETGLFLLLTGFAGIVTFVSDQCEPELMCL